MHRGRDTVPYSADGFRISKLSQPPDFIQLQIHPAPRHLESPSLTTGREYGDPGPLEPDLCRIWHMSFREFYFPDVR
jgi:hypothetical protein